MNLKVPGFYVLGIMILLYGALTMAKNLSSEVKSKPTFPYAVQKTTLENGLDVIVIETPEFKDVLSYNTLVLAGSRNETEPGKTGLAHLFEHILFRHIYGGKEGGYEDFMARLGTHNNAWTWFDVTFYHPLTFTANLTSQTRDGEELPGLVELESSRFKSLKFTEKIFKTEAGAVLGEYRRGASSPYQKLEERAYALLFPHHPYGHTTIGYYEDVLDMPNEYEAAVKFYRTYYRPNNCVLILAGDVKYSKIIPLVKQYYGDWEPSPVPKIESHGMPPEKEQREHVPWDADVAPILWVVYPMPAFRPGTSESAASLILDELLVSETAPLFKKLRYEKKTTSNLGFAEGTQGYQSFDPRALIISAQLFKERYQKEGKNYAEDVIQDILQATEDLKHFSDNPKSAELLNTLKRKYRYDFLASLSSPARIAEQFAWFYRFERDPDVLEKVLSSIDALTPKDIDRLAANYFIPEHRAILTLSYEPSKPSDKN